MKCPKCQIEKRQVKAGLNKSGSQKYKCQECQRRFTPEPKQMGYPQEIGDKAVQLYVDGLNFRRIGRTLGVNHQSVVNWVNAHVAKLPNQPPLPVNRPEVDELFTFIGDKKSEFMS
jgi:transposase-like protein